MIGRIRSALPKQKGCQGKKNLIVRNTFRNIPRLAYWNAKKILRKIIVMDFPGYFQYYKTSRENPGNPGNPNKYQ